MVRDPQGNKVGFTQPGDHPPVKPSNADQRLSSHIMHAGYVYEIGQRWTIPTKTFLAFICIGRAVHPKAVSTG